ncbi:ABC-type glycerol-3-phosphate transport system substrate-binding protein [Paenibacillus harenae]|uniref:ABC-type glycerol-3-phosphate transport system substrate-binding protein n=1 Tax=Paenibacillus harenae TaxID=306543 RepID=A0ABT9U785_PAEHA|nr:ABC-type glycerol-3-phosphate transport system substrate-binding protein [Paenibacillus harenae]
MGSPPSWGKAVQASAIGDTPEKLPDIVELVPNQMKFWYQLGKIEPLSLNHTTNEPYVISSSDGYVQGLKSKINPMIVYYNKAIFESLGLDPPFW